MKCLTCGVEEPHRCYGTIAARHAEAEMIVAQVMRNLQVAKTKRHWYNQRRIENYKAVGVKALNLPRR